jgi:hypothetical protein
MEFHVLFLVGLFISILLNLIVMVKVSAIQSRLSTPIVKKLTPELKLKPRKTGKNPEGQNRKRVEGDSTQESNEGETENSRRNIRPENRGARPDARNNRTDGRSQRNDPNRPRNDRDRNDRDRNDRDRNRKPRHTTPSEMYSNENQNSSSEIAKVATASADQTQIREESSPQLNQNPTQNSNSGFEKRDFGSTGRPSLPPRGEMPAADESASQSSQDSSSDSARVENIRHGRRAQVKKAPNFEEA